LNYLVKQMGKKSERLIEAGGKKKQIHNWTMNWSTIKVWVSG
jgi:hypothetical protein